ncbi:hypothetical protein LMG24235_04174 [Paraburkholderia sabiae]|jgi:hypothetical protein|nr:hypothetical protein LMG24235_04174 [Paraburkholderia sabiae]CAG9237024.1 hypothetical protein PSAB6_70168 [Paraburkholderia sabiae]
MSNEMSNELPSKGRGRQPAVRQRAGAQTELVRLAARETNITKREPSSC